MYLKLYRPDFADFADFAHLADFPYFLSSWQKKDISMKKLLFVLNPFCLFRKALFYSKFYTIIDYIKLIYAYMDI